MKGKRKPPDLTKLFHTVLPIKTQVEIKVTKVTSEGKQWYALMVRDISEEKNNDKTLHGKTA